VITSILLGHFVGDYLLQTRWMFSNKAPFNGALLAHCVVYIFTVFFFLQTYCLLTGKVYDGILSYIAINFVLHLLLDGVVSNVTKVYLKRFDYGSFFVVLGLDQTIHVLTLVNTL
jgi:hypothetical protein